MRRRRLPSSLVLLALLGLALLLMLIPRQRTLRWRSRALSALGPVLAFLRAGSHGEAPLSASITSPRPGQDDPENLKRNAEPTLAEFQGLRAEVVRLREELQGLRARLQAERGTAGSMGGVLAPVIARQSIWGGPVWGIGRGSQQGVREGAGVLYRGAVLGRVVSVGPRAACVALLSHRGLRIAARLAECRAEGIVRGAHEAQSSGKAERCLLRVVSHDLKARVGEKVITSGLDGHFPPGCWIGSVERIERLGGMEWELSVRPACALRGIEWVSVQRSETPVLPWPKRAGRRPRAR